MATIIQKPDSVSFARNLKELIISTSSEISFQLLKGTEELLNETYCPDMANRVAVDLSDIVTSSLTFTMPSANDAYTDQSSILDVFSVKIDGTVKATFTAVRAGVENFSGTASEFLAANWLTWQPQIKEVLANQPEWLTYYIPVTDGACWVRFYYTDGTVSDYKICDFPFRCFSLNTMFSRLWNLDESGKDRYGVIDVVAKNIQGKVLTYVQRYVLRNKESLDQIYLCENSLGGLDTFRFNGDRKLVPEIEYTPLQFDGIYSAADPDINRKWSQNTGLLTDRESRWCWEIFRSTKVYHLNDGSIMPVVLDSSSIEKSDMARLSSFSFEYRYSEDKGLLRVERTDSLPDIVGIPGPDGEIFFLEPRLVDYPEAVLSDTLLLLTQSPFEEKWYKLSIGSIRASILTSILETYGSMLHTHDNLSVLNMLSVDGSGKLLFNGLPVGGGGEHVDTSDFVTLSTAQTITGKKTFAQDVVFGADGSKLFIPSQTPGEWSLYIDPVSGVSGETPQPGGGSDVIWADSPYPGYSGLNVDGTVKDVALRGHLHAVSEISGLLGDDSRILPSLLPDYLLGQLMYGGTVNGSSVATVSAAFKDRYGVSGDTVTVNASDAAQYEGVYFIASADASSGVVLSLGVRTGDWVVSNGTAWTKIDNTDSVSSVAGLTGVIGKSSLQSALSDSSHRFVTDAQITSWNGKWEWDAEQVAGVKVDRAVLADSAVKLFNARRINGTQFDGTEDIVTSVWGMPRSVTVKDFYSENSRVSAGIDGSSDFSLLLPESVRVKVITAGENVFTNLRVPQSAPVAPVSGQMYLYVDSDAGVSGEVPVSGGIDLDAMWAALAGSGTEQINVSHIPSIPLSKVTGLTGAVSTITSANLTANRALVSNASGKVAVSAVTATELGCLDGVRSNVQTQLNNRLPLSGGTMTGAIRLAEGNTADLKGLTVSTGESVLLGYVGDDTYLAQQAGTTRIRSGATNLLHRRNGTDYAILDAYNYASYTVTKTGGGASGTWGINISGNAASATKSATREMPEGTDLNTLGAAVSTVGFANYYRSGGTSVDNTPSDIPDAAGLGFITWRIAFGYSAQLLAAASGGNAGGMIFRKLNSNDNTVLRDWAVVLDSLNVDDYALTRSNYTSYTYPTTVAKISDLHSPWDTLLKAAPSVYVTRWPTAAEVGAYTKAQVDTKLAAYLPLAGGTMTGPIKYVSNSVRYLTLSDSGLTWDFSDVNGRHAHLWLGCKETDGSGYSGMGVYGDGNGLNYLYIGGSYTAPWVAFKPSGNVGIGVTSPSYRLHVGGSAYVNGTVYAASSFNLTNSNGRFVFDPPSDAAYLQGKAGKRLVIGGFNGTTLPQLNLISDDTYATGDFRVGGKLLIPSSEGNNVWSISIDHTAGVSGESPSSGGLDEEAMWAALGSDINTKVIASVHIPKATSSAIGGIRIGFPETGKNYPVELDSSGRAYVNVPWVNTTYSLSSFGITATAAEINKLDGVGTLLHSGNIGSYALTPSNYASYLDSRYVNASGDTMTGPLTITTSSDDILIFNDPDGEKYFRIKAKANGTDWGGLVLDGRSSVQNLYLGTTSSGYKVWHAGNDGSGSELDADLLDGTHKSELLTALTSNATTNLSLTVGGTVKTVADLYATYLEGQTLAETRRGMSFLTSPFSAAGWYRVFTSSNKNTAYTNEVLLHIGRTYTFPQNEHYSFSICVGYNGDISITQLSGVMGGHLITKIRVVWDNIKIFYIDIYSAASSYNNHYGVTGQGDGTFSAFTSGAAIPDGYTAYEFATVDGCKSDRGFTGTLSGNATSATKLQTSRTLWGRPFDGTGNVSGAMTGVTSIDSSLFDLTTASFKLYDSASQAKRLTFNWTSDIARIYAINNSGSGYYDMSLGQTPGNSGALYFDASAAMWGIGTTSPAYKLDVAGTLRATGQGTFDTIKITDNTSAAHLSFGRTDNFNYISMPGDSSTLAIAPGGDISGAGSALCISNSATYPGYHNGTISLGTSSYRWSNVYSMLGNFSGRITAAGLTSSASIVANAGLSTTTLSASGAATLSSTLSVSGLIKALDGVQIGSTNDIGWYNHNSRISAGINTARGVNVGSLLVSNVWSDYTKVPTNGIYSKGDIWTGGRLFVPSSEGNNVWSISIDHTAGVSGESPLTVPFEPLWYGLVSSSGSASKMGGSATVSVTHSDTGYYVVKGVPSTACVIAVPAFITAGMAVTQYRYSATVTRVGDGCTVNMFAASDARANYGFYLMII